MDQTIRLVLTNLHVPGLKIVFGSRTLTFNVSLEKLIASLRYFSDKFNLLLFKENEIHVSLSCGGKKYFDALMKLVVKG